LPAIGINPQLSQLTVEKVTNERALFFGVTSDVFSGNINDFLMFAIGILLLIVLLIAVNLLLSKTNILRVLITRDFKLMVYGECISLIQPATLLWSFILLRQGA